LSAHTNNMSDCCFLIVGARRIAQEVAITPNGATPIMASRIIQTHFIKVFSNEDLMD